MWNAKLDAPFAHVSKRSPSSGKYVQILHIVVPLSSRGTCIPTEGFPFSALVLPRENQSEERNATTYYFGQRKNQLGNQKFPPLMVQ